MVTAGEEKSLSRVKEKRTTKIEFVVKKKYVPNYFFAEHFFVVRLEKPHGKAALCHAPEKCAWQSFECTTKSHFPVMTAYW
jgi:hypothetical protein